jgi:hypothetical protein
VLSTRQSFPADERAHMVGVDTALKAAFVFSAISFLRAALLADSVVRAAGQARAGQLLVHGAASAENL